MRAAGWYRHREGGLHHLVPSCLSLPRSLLQGEAGRLMGQTADVSPPSRWKENTFLGWHHWRRALLQLLGSLNSSSQLPRGAWLPVIPVVPWQQGGAAGAGAASTPRTAGQTGMAVVFMWQLPVPARGWLSLAVPLRGGRVVATCQAVLLAALLELQLLCVLCHATPARTDSVSPGLDSTTSSQSPLAGCAPIQECNHPGPAVPAGPSVQGKGGEESWRVLRAVWMWHLGTWVGAGLGTAGGHSDLRGISNPNDSVIPWGWK